MKKWLLPAAILILVLGIGILAVRFITGQIIAREIAAWSAAAENDPRLIGDHLEVRQLRYEPSLFQGDLHYDLTLRLPSGHPILDTLRALYPGLRTASFPLNGTARVKQGPWLGQEGGIALAELTQRLTFNQVLGAQLPGGAPDDGIALQATLYSDGSVRGKLAGSDYSGDWISESREPMGVEASGLSGTFSWHPDQNQGNFAAEFEQLVLEDPNLLLLLANLTLELNAQQESPGHWRHHSLLAATQGELTTPESRWQVAQPQADTTIQRSGDRISHRVRLKVGESSSEHRTLHQGTAQVLLENLDALAYIALWEQIMEAGNTTGFSPSRIRQIMPVIETLLAGGPTLRIEEMALSLAKEDDVLLDLLASYPEGAPVNFSLPTDMLELVGLNLNAVIDTSALRRISQWQAEAEARELLADRGLERTPEQIQRAATSRYRSMYLALQFMPLVSLEGGKAEAHLELRNGDIYQNGERLMPVTQILRFIGL